MNSCFSLFFQDYKAVIRMCKAILSELECIVWKDERRNIMHVWVTRQGKNAIKKLQCVHTELIIHLTFSAQFFSFLHF